MIRVLFILLVILVMLNFIQPKIEYRKGKYFRPWESHQDRFKTAFWPTARDISKPGNNIWLAHTPFDVEEVSLALNYLKITALNLTNIIKQDLRVGVYYIEGNFMFKEII